MSLDLAKLRFGDVVEGERGERLMVVATAALGHACVIVVREDEASIRGLVRLGFVWGSLT